MLRTAAFGVKAERKVKMYGIQIKLTYALKACATMRLCSRKFDASEFIVTGITFSDFLAMLPAVAGLQRRRFLRVQGSLIHQGVSLCSKCEP